MMTDEDMLEEMESVYEQRRQGRDGSEELRELRDMMDEMSRNIEDLMERMRKIYRPVMELHESSKVSGGMGETLEDIKSALRVMANEGQAMPEVFHWMREENVRKIFDALENNIKNVESVGRQCLTAVGERKTKKSSLTPFLAFLAGAGVGGLLALAETIVKRFL